MAHKEPAGDEHMGKFVYCSQHRNPHSTGWCTVPSNMKTMLEAQTIEDAFKECESKGYTLFKG